MADDEFRMNMQRKLAQQLQEVAQERPGGRRGESFAGAPIPGFCPGISANPETPEHIDAVPSA